MTAAGWCMMGVSCGFVLCLLIFCFYRVFTTPDTREHMHGALEIDTRDVDR